MGNRAIITDEFRQNFSRNQIGFGSRFWQSTRSIPMVNRWMIEGVSFVTSTEATAF